MKKVIFLISTLCAFACSEDTNIVMSDSITYVDHVISENHKIDEAKALEYANIYFNQTETRSSAPLKMDYIVEETFTRSGEMADDTVAYIINRGMADGFVIISSDDRVYPIIGFSPTGNFSYKKFDDVDMIIVSSIKEYVSTPQFDETYTISASEFEGCYASQSVIGSSWGQYQPYNRYVAEE